MKHKTYLTLKFGISILLVLFLSAAGVFAQEATPLPDPAAENMTDTEYHNVDGLENWTYSYDVSDYPDGEYNLIIRSRDNAGNISIADPINLFIDSNSDLPVVSISSPTENMRVGGDFTIIGTAKDDDGVDFVEVRIDTNPYVRVEGENFWSYFMSVKSIPDGVHTVAARTTDINGVQSKEVSKTFYLDKTRPEITVTSHSNGEILSRQVTLRGKVSDANGVLSLEYSLDGESYENLKLSGKKENSEREFFLNIDTRKSEGGTEYIWFRSLDGTGSEGNTVFVYYSDNRNPEISIKSPAQGDVLNGFVTVTGTVLDEVGLKSFSYSLDKEKVPIPLITGNPYWSQTFDLKGRRSVKILFIAEDLSGNIETYKLDLKPDYKADLPFLEMAGSDDRNIIGDIDPAAGYLKGFAGDDDGVKLIVYSIDKEEYRSVDSKGPFLIPLNNLDPGKHSIELHGVDIFGVSGTSEKFSFNILNQAPEIAVDTYTADKIVNATFMDGVVFKQGKTAKISGSVTGGDGALTAVYRIGNREEASVKISGGKFIISLPKDFGEGGYDFKLTVTDEPGRTDVYSSRIYFSPQPGKGSDYKPFKAEKEDGIIIVDSRLDSRLNRDGAANISAEYPVTGYITGYTITEKIVSPAVVDTENPKNSKDAVVETVVTEDTIRSAVLEPLQANFRVEVTGARFSIVAVSSSEPVNFRVKIETVMGKEYLSEELYVGSDSIKPSLSITGGLNTILTDTLHLFGTYSDNTLIADTDIGFSGSAVSYGSGRELKNEKSDDPDVFDMDIDLLNINEGSHFYTVTVTDIYGNSSSETIPFIIDRTPAELTILQPEPDVAVEGMITVCGIIKNFENRGELFFSENGLDFVTVPISGDNGFTHNIDLSGEDLNPEAFIFRVSDRAGNISDLKPDFLVDRESDRPSVSIEIPSDNATISDDFKITGLVFDDDEVGTIFYSMDNGEFKEIDGAKYFNIPYNVETLSDGEHTITVRASDSGGFMSRDSSVTFVVSKAEPVSVLLSPEIEFYTKNTISLKGETYDENGIASVHISYDNGITFNEAVIAEMVPEGLPNENNFEEKSVIAETSLQDDTPVESIVSPSTVRWSYILDTRLPGDGTHSILIKAVDGAGTVGIASTILNIDNTAPEVKLDYPGESEVVSGSLVIDGKVYDGTKVKSVTAELKALEGDGLAIIEEISTDDVFREVIDLNRYEPGWYNLTLTVTDFADNTISETRNFELVSVEDLKSIDIYFPEEGKSVPGRFVVEGRMNFMSEVKKAVLKIDGKIQQAADIENNGLFRFYLTSDDMGDGSHFISVEGDDEGNIVDSEIRNIIYVSDGPWIEIENIISGQFVSGRPMINGTAGYDGSGFDDKSKRVKRVEVSLDNGRSFTPAKGRENWQFRLETYDMSEGVNQLIIRSVLKDGQSCVAKLFVNVDETAPEIDLLVPEENRKFNGIVSLVGTAGDENGLASVEVLIRKGRKEKYQVPSFIQGLYLDFHAMGATYGEVGVGLSFFDDVVKLQAQVGIAPPGRFNGLIIGGKLLANILDIPFSYFFGYDWDFFSMSVAVGANFNYFTMSEDSIEFTDKGVVLGSVLAQFEFAKFDIKDFKAFNKYSLYLEGSLWFISSDIQAGIVPTFSVGARVGIF